MNDNNVQTSSVDPKCPHCGRPVIGPLGIQGAEGLYHQECTESPYKHDYLRPLPKPLPYEPFQPWKPFDPPFKITWTIDTNVTPNDRLTTSYNVHEQVADQKVS